MWWSHRDEIIVKISNSFKFTVDVWRNSTISNTMINTECKLETINFDHRSESSKSRRGFCSSPPSNTSFQNNVIAFWIMNQNRSFVVQMTLLRRVKIDSTRNHEQKRCNFDQKRSCSGSTQIVQEIDQNQHLDTDVCLYLSWRVGSDLFWDVSIFLNIVVVMIMSEIRPVATSFFETKNYLQVDLSMVLHSPGPRFCSIGCC